MKVIVLTALDGAKWHIPVVVVAASHAKYYAKRDGISYEEQLVLSKDYMDIESELIDWAENNMNWSDVSADAVRVSDPDKADMQDSWLEGSKSVEEVPDMIRSAPITAETETLVGITQDFIERMSIQRTFPEGSAQLFVRDRVCPVVSLRQDGSVHVEEGVTLDEAALAFWDAVSAEGKRRAGRPA